MPKSNLKIGVHIDILKPQGNPEKLTAKSLRWLLSTGRYIFIFVELVVLIAFILRFRLDADFAEKKEAIEQQIPYIQSLKPYEILIREAQLKISTILASKSDSSSYPVVLKKISEQMPLDVRLINIEIQKEVSKLNFTINGQAQDHNSVRSFVQGLKQDSSFSDINLISIGLDEGKINFNLKGSAKISEGINL